MIEHTLHIGERVWDSHNCRWGYISLVGPFASDFVVDEESRKYPVLLVDTPPTDKKWHSEWETAAEDCYQVAPDRCFWGEEVCYEHRKDEFDEEHDFDFFCPERNENCWESEVSH